MNHNEGHYSRPRQTTLPPVSHRTLHHPSFLPLYMAAGFANPRAVCSNQAVHPIIPSEFFYSDPTMSTGRRIPNIVSELRVFDCFQLNTPPPIMSTCPAPPARRDPFRSGPHPTRDLGSLAFKVSSLHPPEQPRRVIVQLTQEEDEAITNLLKLHHQEPTQSNETLSPLKMDLHPTPFQCHHEPMDSTSAEDIDEPFCGHVQHPIDASLQSQLQQGRCWSDTELDAAKTLLSRFSLMEISGQNDNESAATRPDPQPNQGQGSENVSVDSTQNGGDLGFMERGNVVEEHLASSLSQRPPSLSLDSEAKSRLSVSGDLTEAKEQMLSDSEGNAVHALLSLGNMGALDTMQ